MCIIIHKPETGIIPANILDNAETKNADGFGITFLDTMETFKTLDYNKARVMAESERPFVLHYRYATVGDVNADNCHPFPAKDGVLYSNGTVADLGDKDESDTSVVAGMLDKIPKKYWKDILCMTEVRFAIISGKGEVSRFGKWHERNKVFYSKDNCFTWKPAPYNNNYQNNNYARGGGSYVKANKPVGAPSGNTSGYQYNRENGWQKKDGVHIKVSNDAKPNVEHTPALGYFNSEADEDPNEGYMPIVPSDVMTNQEYEELRGELSDEEVFEIARAYNAGEMSYMEYASVISGVTAYEPIEYDRRDQWEIDAGIGDWDDLDVLAVYGTLKMGYGNHRLLEGADFLGEAETVEKLRMTCNGIPYLYDGKSEEGHQVEVELYEVKGVNAKIDIDHLEGHPSHYRRTRKQFVTPMGIECEAWVYVSARGEPYRTEKFWPRYKGRLG